MILIFDCCSLCDGGGALEEESHAPLNLIYP